MSKKDILNKIIDEILETNLIYKDISYKLENNNDFYINLYYINNSRIDKIYYDNFLQVVSYLQGIRKTIYSLERSLQNEK